MLKNYKELNVWQKSYKLCLHIYQVTKHFPKDEMYGLTSQIRRSAVSIPSNIAEGYGRKSTLEYVRFLYIAYGSVCEQVSSYKSVAGKTCVKDPLLSSISEIKPPTAEKCCLDFSEIFGAEEK